jgi:hypothetical protein
VWDLNRGQCFARCNSSFFAGVICTVFYHVGPKWVALAGPTIGKYKITTRDFHLRVEMDRLTWVQG